MGAPKASTRVRRPTLAGARARFRAADSAWAAARADLWLLGTLATQADRARVATTKAAAERAWRAFARLILAPITPAPATGPGPNLTDGALKR